MNRKITITVSLVIAMLMLFSSLAYGLTKSDITKIAFDKSSITMEMGSTFTPKVTLTPDTALKNQLKWSTSNNSIAVVNFEGTISALNEGTATIKAASPDGKVSASIAVTVKGRAAPIEIKVMAFERGRPGEQPADTGYWAKWIQAGVLKDLNIKVTLVPVARPNANATKDAINLLIAANNAPDLFGEYDQSPGYLAWLGQGAYQEISMDMIKQYAPNYLKYEGTSVVKYGNIKGKQMFLPAKRPIPLDSTYVTMIRQDWLDQVGLTNPKTTDELFNVLSAFKDKIGTVNGNKVIPYCYQYDSATNAATANWIFRPDNYSNKEKYMYSDVSLPALSWEPEKKRLQFWNKLFNAGLISPEFMLDNDGSKARSAFMNGYGGIWYEYINQDAGYISTLMKNVPSARLSVLYPYTVRAGAVSTSYYYTPPVGLMNGISKNCKHVPEVLRYLDWMSKPENLKVLQWGIDGKTYNTVNGKPVLTGYKGDEQLLNGSNKDYYCMVVEGIDMGNDWDNMEIAACPPGENFRYLMETNFKYLRTPYNKPTPNVFIPQVISSATTYSSSLVTKFKEYSVKLITCKPDEFIFWYNQYSKDYLDSGYQKILDEKAKTYDDYFGK